MPLANPTGQLQEYASIEIPGDDVESEHVPPLVHGELSKKRGKNHEKTGKKREKTVKKSDLAKQCWLPWLISAPSTHCGGMAPWAGAAMPCTLHASGSQRSADSAEWSAPPKQ